VTAPPASANLQSGDGYSTRVIRFVSLDLYHTLVGPRPLREVRMAEACADLGMHVEPGAFGRPGVVADDYYSTENGRWPLHTRTTEEQQAFYRAFYGIQLHGAGLPSDHATCEKVRELMWSRRGEWVIHEDALPAIDEMRAAGLTLGILSNTPVDATPMCARLGLAEKVHFIVSSCLVGCEKPDPRIFHVGLEAAGVAAREALHIGDQRLSDSVGAEAVGMETLLLDRTGILADEERFAKIASLHDILPWIRARERAPRAMGQTPGVGSLIR